MCRKVHPASGRRNGRRRRRRRHRQDAPSRDAARRPIRPGGRRIRAESRRLGANGSTTRRARGPRLPPTTSRWPIANRRGGRRRRRHRGHPERQPLRHRQHLPAQGHLRRLREAADTGLRDGGRTGRDRRVIRCDSCCPTLLLGLCDGPARGTLVRDGELGAIRFVAVEHASGWAATPLELTGHKQAGWRTDPEIAGETSVVGRPGDACVSPAALRHRSERRPRFRRIEHPGPGPARVRQRRHSADALERRARHAVGLHGRNGQRARPSHTSLRRPRQPGMAPRGSAPSASFAISTAAQRFSRTA